MNLIKILIVLAIVSVLVIFGVSKCGSLQVGTKALETVAALKEANSQMKSKVAELERDLASAKATLVTSEAQTEALSAENVLLKELSKERVRKLWSMYEPGT